MNKVKSFPAIIALLLFVSILAVFAAMQPAAFSIFNLSSVSASNVGSAIGGIIGPVVSIYSAYLLYEALTAQQHGLKEQRMKTSVDSIFVLLVQLQQDVDKFYITTSTRKAGSPVVEETVFGFRALMKYAQAFSSSETPKLFKIFKDDTKSDDIISFIRAYELIVKYISLVELDTELSLMVRQRVEMLYITKLKVPLRKLTEAFVNIEDPLMKELNSFYQKQSVKGL